MKSNFVTMPSGHELEETWEGESGTLMKKSNIVLLRSWNQNNNHQVFLGVHHKKKALGEYWNSFAFGVP